MTTSEAPTTYLITKAVGRVVNGHAIIMAPVVGGGVTLTVWVGPNRLDGWVHGYIDTSVAIDEARRTRALIERYGSIAEVDRTHAKTASEIPTCRDRARLAHLNRACEETENLADRAAVRALVANVTTFLKNS